MRNIMYCIYSLIAALGFWLTSAQPASATALAGVDVATWSISFLDPLDVITVDYHLMSVSSSTVSSGGGFANTGFVTSVSDDFVGQLGHGISIVTGPGYAATDLEVLGIVSVTNTSAFPLVFGDVVGGSDFSAFNPGGNSIGASVNDPLREFALFESFVLLDTTFYFDTSENSTLVVALAIRTEASVVSEPMTLSIFGVGLIGLLLVKRRRRLPSLH